MNQHPYRGSGISTTNIDVMHFPVVAQGELAVLVHDIISQTEVIGDDLAAGLGLGPCVKGLCGSCAIEGAMRPGEVVVLAELIELALEISNRCHFGLLSQPLLQGLVKAFHFAAGLGMVGTGVLLDDFQTGHLCLESVAAASRSAGEDRSVIAQNASR